MTILSTVALALLSLADPPTAADLVSALETATVEAIARAQPSVVAIARIRGDEPEKTTAIRGELPVRPGPNPIDNGNLNGFANPGIAARPLRFEGAAPGDFSSGVVIGAGGEILTTYHTLRGASQIWVRSPDRKEFEAEILAADPRSDLAVIAPRDSADQPALRLTPIKVGNATKLRPGTFLIALGNAYNAARDGKASASWGILSNTARKIHAPQYEEKSGDAARKFFRYQPTLLQLDSKLNLGMSGGAVVNMKGELVGLTTAAASPVAYDVQAGYAIPMDNLGRHIAETLRQGREVEYGFLGIGLAEEIPNGVGNVGKGTPADKANLVTGDVILAVGDRQLDEDDGLTMALSTVTAGQTVKLKILRNGRVEEKTILVSKYPVLGPVIASNRPKAWRGLRVDFTSVLGGSSPFSEELMRAMSKGGVGIVEVETGSTAEAAGLRKDLVITAVDGQPVPTPADFARVVATKEGKDVTLTTENGPRPGEKVVLKK
ncbi:MAG: trypsin-like serine protease with C-terminal domain [Planctomycetota bacterium]|nr:trypsin-like serine protease with C-terminal domain [Planctomycetota bacterium]